MRILHVLASVPRRRARRALLALALAIVGLAIGAVVGWAQYHLYAAERALKLYALDEAQHHLDSCLKVRSSSSRVRLLAAQTARRRDAYEEAEQHLAACMQRQDVLEAAELEQQLLAAQQGELDEVEGLLRARVTRETPEAALVLEALAKGYLNRFAYDNALDCVNILLERQPRHPQALLMRARLLAKLARKGETEHEEAALRAYKKAVKLNPSFEARLDLAGLLFRMGHPWEAACEYEKLRSSNPSDPELLFGLARCRYSLHELEEARRLLDELLQQKTSRPRLGLAPFEESSSVRQRALLERGRMALRTGDLKEAEQRLREAVLLAPRFDCEALRGLRQCLKEAHQTEEARQCLDEIGVREKEVLEVERLTLRSNRDPNDVALMYEIGRRWLRLGHEEEGVAALFSVLEKERSHQLAREALADYFERVGQPKRALFYRRLPGEERRADLSAR